MGGKHLKKLRAEKSKVHLKKKKEKVLPKGQNIIKTKFTVKKILTVEQLKKVEENEPVSSWNVPLKDLLIRLNHYSATSRLNGLSGIKEILFKNPEILKGPSLKSVVCRLLELITDEEPKVRVTTVDLLKYLFELIPAASIVPFYDFLNVHIGCAMTHRSSTVQLDSLKLIDIMIKYSPEAIKHNFRSIIQNFIRILKNQLFGTQINMFIRSGSNYNLEKKKTEILQRFYKFLVVGWSENMDEKRPHHTSINFNIVAKEKVSRRDFCDQYKKIPNLLFKDSEERAKRLTEFDLNEFQHLCSLIVSMIFNAWVEFSPSQVASECLLSEEIGELLLILLKILLVLYLRAVSFENSEMVSWFITNFGSRFQKLFTSNFPYTLSLSVKNSESKYEFSGRSSNIMVQNLIICYLSYSFNVIPKNSCTETKMENYLSDVLKRNLEEIEILSRVIEVMVNASVYKKPNIILNEVIAAYSATENLELQQSLSKILVKTVLKENECLKDNILMDWMKSLPLLLCKPQIYSQDIETILKLITRPVGVEILREVECNVEKIIKNLPSIKINGILEIEGQKMIANILYKCNNEVLEKVIKNKILGSTLYPEALRNYIMNIFLQKLKY